MYDVALFYGERARTQSAILNGLNLKDTNFALATCHRAENTDNAHNLEQILSALSEISSCHLPVVLALHPRTQKKIEDFGLSQILKSLIVTEPLPFLDMIALEQAAQLIFTDSGGVQKEAFFYNKPCITMRLETEWVETIDSKWNVLVGPSKEKIMDAFLERSWFSSTKKVNPYGIGKSSQLVIEKMLE
jgi:UDP-GlcNAc3NAcA epimerase